VCDKESVAVEAAVGGHRCQCRRNFRWNEKAGECQLYLDVDCSDITYDTPPSPVVLQAVNITLEKVGGGGSVSDDEEGELSPLDENDIIDGSVAEANITREESLKNSLLSSIDPVQASEADIREAFCRDVDSFSFEFGQGGVPPPSDGVSGTAGAFGLLVFVIFISCCCCGCVLSFRSIQRVRAARRQHLSNLAAGTALVGVAELAEKEASHGGDEYHANPTYQPQPTPLHVNMMTPYPPQPTYPVLPAQEPPAAGGDPAPIPPTQPGYTNTYPAAAAGAAPPYPPYAQPLPYPVGEGGQAYPQLPAYQPYPPYNPSATPAPNPYPAPPPFNPSAPY
jgi:hypothetical protein